MSTVRHRDDLGHALIALLILVGGVRDRRGDRVVLVPGDDQQGSAVGVLGIDLRLGPGVEVFGCRLEQGGAWGRHREGFVEFLRLFLANGVGESVAELLVGQRDCAVAVGWIAEHRRCRLQRRERQREHSAEWRGINRHGYGGEPASSDDLRH